MFRQIAITLLLLGIGTLAYAQEGQVYVQKDTLISLLQRFRAEAGLQPTTANKVSIGSRVVDKTNARRVKARGFRVQIFAGASRSDAYAVQERFKTQHKDHASYVSYDEPNYRVKVGDFTSRSAANNFMRILRSQYDNVFLFTEDIWVYR